ncbi:MAG: hypothetical protein JNJ46_22745 [Myxococcales bacterium]|nr:hypothetical protein [Myxococcales bacterium]
MRNANSPVIVATLDLTDGNHRQLHDLIQRTHTGRWRSYRALAMRQHTAGITELAETIPRRKKAQKTFVVLRWSLAPLGFSWDEHACIRAAECAYDRAFLGEKRLRSKNRCGTTSPLRESSHDQNQTSEQQRGRARPRIAG